MRRYTNMGQQARGERAGDVLSEDAVTFTYARRGWLGLAAAHDRHEFCHDCPPRFEKYFSKTLLEALPSKRHHRTAPLAPVVTAAHPQRFRPGHAYRRGIPLSWSGRRCAQSRLWPTSSHLG